MNVTYSVPPGFRGISGAEGDRYKVVLTETGNTVRVGTGKEMEDFMRSHKDKFYIDKNGKKLPKYQLRPHQEPNPYYQAPYGKSYSDKSDEKFQIEYDRLKAKAEQLRIQADSIENMAENLKEAYLNKK